MCPQNLAIEAAVDAESDLSRFLFMAVCLEPVEYRENPFSPNRPTGLYDLDHAHALDWIERHAQSLARKWNRGLALGRTPETDVGLAYVAKVLKLPAGHRDPFPAEATGRRQRRPKFRPVGCVLPVATAG